MLLERIQMRKKETGSCIYINLSGSEKKIDRAINEVATPSNTSINQLI